MINLDTKEGWWQAVDDCWDDLVNLLERFVEDFDRHKIESLKGLRNRKMHRVFEEAWSNAPDTPILHQMPGWGLLCDLCSECGVLYE